MDMHFHARRLFIRAHQLVAYTRLEARAPEAKHFDRDMALAIYLLAIGLSPREMPQPWTLVERLRLAEDFGLVIGQPPKLAWKATTFLNAAIATAGGVNAAN